MHAIAWSRVNTLNNPLIAFKRNLKDRRYLNPNYAYFQTLGSYKTPPIPFKIKNKGYRRCFILNLIYLYVNTD